MVKVILFLLVFFFTIPLLNGNYETKTSPWGIDSDMALPPSNGGALTFKKENIPTRIASSMIHFFQSKISPIDGPRSHFYPTSSEYTLLAIKKYGVMKGFVVGCDRLMRENKEDWVYPLIDKYGIKRKFDPVR